mmetsp:Transcript_24286/g.48308  ORF Transcript_24286/g.48308 Transcript_24286/m.48308 type:complete len:431 (-) Transcript_24286:20-1312(-)
MFSSSHIAQKRLVHFFEVRLISQPPGRHELHDAETHATDGADGPDRDVEPPHELVAAAHVGGLRQHQRLFSLEAVDGPVRLDLELQHGAPGNVGVGEVAVQLPELGQGRRPHPHQKVLVEDALDGIEDHRVDLVGVERRVLVGIKIEPARAVGICVGLRAGPLGVVAGTGRALAAAAPLFSETEDLAEFPFEIRFPRNLIFPQREAQRPPVVAAGGVGECDDVVEERVGNETARIEIHRRIVTDIRQFVQGGAGMGGQGRDGPSAVPPPPQLIVVPAVEVLLVVLVEVLDLVVHVHRRRQVPLHRETDRARRAAVVPVVRRRDPAPRRRVARAGAVVLHRHLRHPPRGRQEGHPARHQEDRQREERRDHVDGRQDGHPRRDVLLPEVVVDVRADALGSRRRDHRNNRKPNRRNGMCLCLSARWDGWGRRY